jgi:hypothetical protein
MKPGVQLLTPGLGTGMLRCYLHGLSCCLNQLNDFFGMGNHSIMA